MLAHRLVKVVPPQSDRCFQGLAEGKTRGDRCRKGTARSVNVGDIEPLPRKKERMAVQPGCVADRVVVEKASPFYENLATEEVGQRFGRFLKSFPRIDFAPQQNLGLRQVGRDQSRRGQQFLLHQFHSRFVEQRGSGCGLVDGVHDEMDLRIAAEKVGDHLDIGGSCQHPGLGSAERVFRFNPVQLLIQQGRIDRLDLSDLSRNFGDHCCDSGQPVGPQGGKSLEVGLDSSSCRRIGARDGESNRRIQNGVNKSRNLGRGFHFVQVVPVETENPYPKSIFAEKLTGHSGTCELMDDLGEALTLGRGKLRMMGGGNPGHIPEMQEIFRKRMLELVQDTPDEFDRVLADYDQPAGSPAFREVVADFLKREYGWNLTRKNIAITNGGQTAFFFLLNRFAGKMAGGGQKKILLPIVPEYIGYGDQGVADVELFDSRKPVIERISEREFKYRIDFENLNISDEHGAIAVSRPTNPSSNVLTDNEIAKLRELAAEQGIPLIIDNAYGQPFPGVIFPDVSPVWDENIILTMSLSKLGLPGTRTGIIVAREEVINDMRSMTAIVGLANNNVGQAIARPLIESGEVKTLSETVIRPFYKKRSDLAVALAHESLPDSVPWRIHQSEGAFFLWFCFENLPIGCRELYRKLKSADLVVVPGEYFFYGLDKTAWPHARQCVRVSFTQPEEIVRDGFKILGKVLEEVYR